MEGKLISNMSRICISGSHSKQTDPFLTSSANLINVFRLADKPVSGLALIRTKFHLIDTGNVSGI
jgi:hypothetical protein